MSKGGPTRRRLVTVALAGSAGALSLGAFYLHGARPSKASSLASSAPDNSKTKGQQLRAAIDEFYARLLIDDRPRTAPGAYSDISEILRRYIPIGSSMDKAEEIVSQAGFSFRWSRQMAVNSKRDDLKRCATEAVLTLITISPIGCMDAGIQLFPAAPKFEAVGQACANIRRMSWYHGLLSVPE
jgi:hypothetical protein